MVNVLFSSPLSTSVTRYLADALAERQDVRLEFSGVEAGHADGSVENADIIVGARVSKALVDSATRLKLFIIPFTGVDRIIEDLCIRGKSPGFLVTNSHSHARSVAQHAVALLLSLTNRVVWNHRAACNGNWKLSNDVRNLPMTNLRIGLVGYGAINRHVHRLLAGFDSGFAVLRRSQPGENDANESLASFSPDRIDEFFEQVDVAIIAAPLTDETRNLIGARQLDLLGPGGLLVNVSRGAVINERDLYESLSRRSIGGAAVDAWYDEHTDEEGGGRPPYKFPFQELENLVISPYQAGSSEDETEPWRDVVENIVRFVDGKELKNLVDCDKGY